jgi:hypothetical protein
MQGLPTLVNHYTPFHTISTHRSTQKGSKCQKILQFSLNFFSRAYWPQKELSKNILIQIKFETVQSFMDTLNHSISFPRPVPSPTVRDLASSYPHQDQAPIFESAKAAKAATPCTLKAWVEHNWSHLAAPRLFNRNGSRSLASLNGRKINCFLANHQRLERFGYTYSEEYLQTLFQMPNGESKTVLLLDLAANDNLSKKNQFKCLLNCPSTELTLSLMKFFTNENKLSLATWAQNATLDATFRAQCILHMPSKAMLKQTKQKLIQELLKDTNLALKYQAKLSFLLENGQLKKQHLMRLAKESGLPIKYKTECIFYFPPSSIKDDLILSYLQTPELSIDRKVAAAVFIQEQSLRNATLIEIYHQEPEYTHARVHCVICLDKGEERSKMQAELQQIPQASSELCKADAVLRTYYPYIQDLESLSISQKIKALYASRPATVSEYIA